MPCISQQPAFDRRQRGGWYLEFEFKNCVSEARFKMNTLKRHIATLLNTLLVTSVLATAGTLEVKANKFDKGFLPPGKSIKARRQALAFRGQIRGRAGAPRGFHGQGWQAPENHLTGDWNSDGQDTIGRRNRTRARSTRRSLQNNNHKRSILPYIEHDNL